MSILRSAIAWAFSLRPASRFVRPECWTFSDQPLPITGTTITPVSSPFAIAFALVVSITIRRSRGLFDPRGQHF